MRNKLSAQLFRQQKQDALDIVKREVEDCDAAIYNLKTQLDNVSSSFGCLSRPPCCECLSLTSLFIVCVSPHITPDETENRFTAVVHGRDQAGILRSDYSSYFAALQPASNKHHLCK
jgi:hypothetical protein